MCHKANQLIEFIKIRKVELAAMRRPDGILDPNHLKKRQAEAEELKLKQEVYGTIASSRPVSFANIIAMPTPVPEKDLHSQDVPQQEDKDIHPQAGKDVPQQEVKYILPQDMPQQEDKNAHQQEGKDANQQEKDIQYQQEKDIQYQQEKEANTKDLHKQSEDEHKNKDDIKSDHTDSKDEVQSAHSDYKEEVKSIHSDHKEEAESIHSDHKEETKSEHSEHKNETSKHSDTNKPSDIQFKPSSSSITPEIPHNSSITDQIEEVMTDPGIETSTQVFNAATTSFFQGYGFAAGHAEDEFGGLGLIGVFEDVTSLGTKTSYNQLYLFMTLLLASWFIFKKQ